MDNRWGNSSQVSRSRLFVAVGLVIAGMLFTLATETAHAHHLLPKHQLRCGKSFPCPDAIKPRVRFWIEVFRLWDSDTAILHDPTRPERIYTVFKSEYGCYRRARPHIKKKRTKVKNDLLALADKVKAGKPILGRNERHLVKMFPKKDPKEIRAAAANIRCQSGVHSEFLKGLKRFNYYRPMIDKVLRENNLPEDIRYLPFVESSYNTAAYSKAGAAGMWQIMPRTARVLGLKLNYTLDERFDPVAATHAAAKYLKRAEKSLTTLAKEKDAGITKAEINPFIITSYNYGVQGMRRAISEEGPDFMTVLERHKSPRFQTAVKNFYASFLAARHVARHASRYFGSTAISVIEQRQAMVLPHDTSIARIKTVFGLGRKELRPLNRTLTRNVWNGLRQIPAGYRMYLPVQSDGWEAQIKKLISLGPEKGFQGGTQYVVRRGDTVCGIANAIRVNCNKLLRINRLTNPDVIRVGQKLLIPGNPIAVSYRNGQKIYKVRRGDTACGIALRFSVNCNKLRNTNKLNQKAVIHPGQELKIPSILSVAQTPSEPTESTQKKVQVASTKPSVPKQETEQAKTAQVEKPRVKPVDTSSKISSTATTAAKATTKVTTETATVANTEENVNYPISVTGGADAYININTNFLSNVLDELPDLRIREQNQSGELVYTIRVEADETLGHFADWLEIDGPAILRDLNNLQGQRFLQVGQQLRVPVKNAEVAMRFEERRANYHEVLSESLKEYYNLIGIESYRVQNGDSLWLLARQKGFPLWLLYRLNPSLADKPLQTGQSMVLPKLMPKF